jgi:bifunctional DNA-binding transcriptional regulator/antitoxin component of YhaV-PrlF toxin-antitoxin module
MEVFRRPLVRRRGAGMKVLFDTRRIQKLGRVALSEQLLKNAGLEEGDRVDIYFDVATKRILIEPAAQRADHVVSEKISSKRSA